MSSAQKKTSTPGGSATSQATDSLAQSGLGEDTLGKMGLRTNGHCHEVDEGNEDIPHPGQLTFEVVCGGGGGNLDCHQDVTVMLAEHKLQPYRVKLIHS